MWNLRTLLRRTMLATFWILPFEHNRSPPSAVSHARRIAVSCRAFQVTTLPRKLHSTALSRIFYESPSGPLFMRIHTRISICRVDSYQAFAVEEIGGWEPNAHLGAVPAHSVKREKSSDRHDFHSDAHSQEAAERSGISTANRHHTAWMRANAGSDMLLGGSFA